jgi:hypothetical protein
MIVKSIGRKNMTNDKQILHAVKRIANAEIEAARKYRDDGIKYFKGDQEMIDMYRGDCRDRVEAARLAKNGQFVEAFETIRMMDTAARDSVTDEFYNMLYQFWSMMKRY